MRIKKSKISWKKVGFTCGLITLVGGGSLVVLETIGNDSTPAAVAELPPLERIEQPVYHSPQDPYDLFGIAEINKQDGMQIIEDASAKDMEMSFVSDNVDSLTNLPQNSITMKIDKTANVYMSSKDSQHGALNSSTIHLGKINDTKVNDKPADSYPAETRLNSFKDVLEGIFSKTGVESGTFIGLEGDQGVWVITEREEGYIINLVVFNKSDAALIRMDLDQKEFPEILKTFSLKKSS